LPNSNTPFPLQTIPDDIASLITTSLDHFSTSLLSSACGRDLFSHVSSCADCYSAYRDWICRITVPQCASTAVANAPIAPQTVDRTSDSRRVSDITPPYAYTELLPCLSICNRADRRCPAFMQFRCPRRLVNAQQSYAFLGVENDQDDGDSANGIPASDRWGNRWCNA
jgi:calcium channel MID1